MCAGNYRAWDRVRALLAHSSCATAALCEGQGAETYSSRMHWALGLDGQWVATRVARLLCWS